MNWIMESESDWESCRSARHGPHYSDDDDYDMGDAFEYDDAEPDRCDTNCVIIW